MLNSVNKCENEVMDWAMWRLRQSPTYIDFQVMSSVARYECKGDIDVRVFVGKFHGRGEVGYHRCHIEEKVQT